MIDVIRNLFITLFLLPLLFFVSSVQAKHIPAPTGYINDFAGVLTSEQKTTLENSLREYEQKTSNEIAVALVKSLQGGEIDDFTVRAFEEWKIGKKGQDNGLLFLAAIDDREMRIEVGYGLEPYLTDGEAGEIIRNTITPEFHKGNYYQGINSGIEKIKQEITNNTESSWFSKFKSDVQLKWNWIYIFVTLIYPILIPATAIAFNKIIPIPIKPSERRRIYLIRIFLFLAFNVVLYRTLQPLFQAIHFTVLKIVSVAFLFIYIGAFLARSKQFWAGGVIGGFLGLVIGFWLNSNLNSILVWIFLLGGGGLMLDYILSKNYKRLRNDNQPTGFFSSWGGLKGFGGFGGGISGGGGASGRW